MKALEGIEAFATYRRAFLAPMSITQKVKLGHREGVLLRGHSGAIGDLCPLPGYSLESLDESVASLDSSRPLQSAEWALCCARGKPLQCDSAIKSALLLPALTPIEKLLEHDEHQRSVVKAKVGRAGVEKEIAWIASLLPHVGELRLDGNRALTVKAALQLAEAAEDKLSFFEEPVCERDLHALMPQVPVALDESLAKADFKNEGLFTKAHAYVVKPTHLGRKQTQTILEFCNRENKKVVISSLYESPYGHAHLCALAKEVGATHAHGLGTQSYLERFDDAELEWKPIDAL